MSSITLCPTKAGKGYKVVVKGEWFYTSTGEFLKMLSGKAAAVSFRTLSDRKQESEVTN